MGKDFVLFTVVFPRPRIFPGIVFFLQIFIDWIGYRTFSSFIYINILDSILWNKVEEALEYDITGQDLWLQLVIE